MKRPDTKRPTKRSGYILQDLTESQLAGIGKVAIAYNEAEILIDIMLAISNKLPGELGVAITSRINGVDGKIEIVKLSFQYLGASEEVLSALSESCGQLGLLGLKVYRDGIIHSRILDAPLGIGKTIAKRGKFNEILLTVEALDGVFSRLACLRWEFICLANILSCLMSVDAVSYAERISASSSSKERLAKVAEMHKTRTEQDILGHLARYQAHLKSRQSLSPLPEFPDEPPEPPSSEDSQEGGGPLPGS